MAFAIFILNFSLFNGRQVTRADKSQKKRLKTNKMVQ